MKKILFGALLAVATGSLSSCEENSKNPAPEFTSVPLIFAKVSSDVEKSYFNTTRAAASINNLPNTPDVTPADPRKGQRPVFEFTFDVPDQRDVRIQAVEVYKSFQRDIRIGPRVLVGSYDSFPATVSLNSQEALTGLQQLFFSGPSATLPTLRNLLGATPNARNEVITGDVIVFTFEYVLEDGSRIILTPLSDVRLAGNATPAKVISGTQINPPYALYARFFVLP
ncbi:hypothetical protein [Hymenobacter sp.]|uniref:hypothetical protein n=1 Tax=Hymenobacter sp. TaxID=1898978 RepID=UPI00286B7355|nr:hypothetical protein [Hymenobacter sp.]